MVSSEDLEVTGDDLTLQKENIALEAVPHVKELLADLLQVVDWDEVKDVRGTAPILWKRANVPKEGEQLSESKCPK